MVNKNGSEHILYIAYRVQKILEEAIADAVDELMDRYGLNR